MPKKGPKLPQGMVALDLMTVPKAVFKNLKNLICVDYGTSLIKLMFITQKDWNTDQNNYVFTCTLFKRQNLKECLKWMKENVYLENINKIVMTGIGGKTIKNSFIEAFNLEIEFVPELPAQCKGFCTMLECMGKDKIFFERETPTTENIEPSNVVKELHAKHSVPENNPEWPVIFIYAGASSVIMILNQDATYEVIGTSMTSGKSLMGLCSLMLNTGEYEEIAPLAVKGERKGVDTCVWEIVKDPEGSTYAHLPTECPVFSFGKPGDYNKSLYKYKRTDLATSGVYFIACNMAHELVTLCKLSKIYRVIVGGNMFKAQVLRQFIVDNLALLKMDKIIQLDFVNTGHTGALGALVLRGSASS